MFVGCRGFCGLVFTDLGLVEGLVWLGGVGFGSGVGSTGLGLGLGLFFGFFGCGVGRGFFSLTGSGAGAGAFGFGLGLGLGLSWMGVTSSLGGLAGLGFRFLGLVGLLGLLALRGDLGGDEVERPRGAPDDVALVSLLCSLSILFLWSMFSLNCRRCELVSFM